MTCARGRLRWATVPRSRAFGLALLLAALAWPPPRLPAGDDPRAATPATPLAPAPRPLTDLYGDRLPAGAVARLGSVRLRHLGLADFFLQPDGRTARTVGRDGFLRTWDLESGRQTDANALGGERGKAAGWPTPLFPGERPTEREPHLTFSPNRKLLAAVFAARVVVWDAETGRELKSLDRPGAALERGTFSPDGRTLALLASEKLTLLEWRTDLEWAVKFPVGHDRNGFNVCRQRFTPDGRHLIVWNWSVGATPVGVFEVSDSGVNERYTLAECESGLLAVSPDGKCLVAGRGEAGTDVLLLDLATGKERGRIKSAGGARAVAFSPDGKTLALGEQDGDKKRAVRLLDPATRTERARYELDEVPRDLLFSPDGKVLACFLWPGVVLLDTTSGRLTQCPDAALWGATFTPDGRALVSTGYGRGRRLRVWDVATGRERHDRPAELVPDGLAGRTPDLVPDPTGRVVAVSDHAWGRVYLWDTADGTLIRRLAPPEKERWGDQLALAPDGRTLLAIDRDGSCRELDVRSGAERRAFQLNFPAPPQHGGGGLSFSAQEVRVSPDFRRAITSLRVGTTTRFLIRDLAGNGPGREASFTGEVCAWAWPNAAVWVSKDRGVGLSVVSALTGRTRVRVPGFVPWGGPVAFSPDGRLLAVLAEGYTRVEVREVATGRAVATVDTGRVQSLALAPDGRRLLTAGAGGLRVWDLATGGELQARWTGERAAGDVPPACERVTLTPEGRKAVTVLADGTGLVWDLGRFPVEPLASGGWEACWADLLRADAGAAHGAMWRLAEARSADTVRFLAARVKPVEGPDPAAVGRGVAELGDADFQTREAAQGRLAALGPLVEADLLRAVDRHESPEVRLRARELLGRMPRPMPTGEPLRVVRVIAVLERVGTTEARKVLAELAGGASGAPETEEAGAALARLTARATRP